MKSALRYTNAWTFAAMRNFFGALVLFTVAIILRHPLRPSRPLLTTVVGLLGITGASSCSMWALHFGRAGKTSVLVYTIPVWMLLMAGASFFQQPPSPLAAVPPTSCVPIPSARA